MNNQQDQRDAGRLVDLLVKIGRCVIAYSGGVDSAVVAAAAHRADQVRISFDSASAEQGRSIAVTADSPSVSREQLDIARRVAIEIGLRHEVVSTDEINRQDYRVNDQRRCFFCKETLYSTLGEFAQQQAIPTILSGTNADDLGDYRPGIEAGNLAGVVAPLASLGLRKTQVRAVAKLWGLSIFDRPAQPCLSSRIAYGVAVTRQRLQKIELAEQFLRNRNYSPLRVRLLGSEEASIEVADKAIDRLSRPEEIQPIIDYLVSIGFRSVRIDPRGFRSGSMNEVVQIGVCPSPSGST